MKLVKKTMILVLLACVAAVLISGCTTPSSGNTLSGETLAQKFSVADATIEKQTVTIPEFEAVKDKNPQSLLQAIEAYPNAGVIQGNTASLSTSSSDLLIVELADSLEADTFALNLSTQLETEGYSYKGRLQYEETSNQYQKEGKNLFVLKKGKLVFLVKEK
ncbi:MAG: hypothetical protein V1777_03860 [Candidatus Micrarchaeota archaeon]